MKVCITGSRGFIGKQLLKEAIPVFEHINVLSRKDEERSAANVSVILGDLSDPSCPLDIFLEDCDIVYHCAGEIRDVSLMKALHVDGTALLVTAVKKEARKRKRNIHFVHLSSVGVYGPPSEACLHRVITEDSPYHPYGEYECTKALSDKILINEAEEGVLSYTILRPSNVIGIGMRNNSLKKLATLIRNNFYFTVGSGDAIATYVHVNDVSRALIACGLNPRARNQVYNLSNDFPMNEMLNAIAASVGKSLPSFQVSENLIRCIANVINGIVSTPLTKERIDALVIKTEYPSDKIRSELNFTLNFNIVETIGDILSTKTKIKIARIVTVPIVYTHIMDLLDFLHADERFELHLVCSKETFLDEMMKRYPKAFFHIINIPRNIQLFNDFMALMHLSFIMLRIRFDIVHSHTPKAGLLSALAGFITGRKNRLHTFTGQVWVHMTGLKKALLKNIDKIITILNTHNYADSFGQRNFLIKEYVGKESTLSVIHKGSLGGINIERFNPERLTVEINELKSKLYPGFAGKIILYLGRINRDKGLSELASAFEKLKATHSLKLLLVGPIEMGDDGEFISVLNSLKLDPDVMFINFTSVPEVFLGIADVFCFPSYREGFGTVALEASAMEKPIIASDIYGLSDAVLNNETGLLFEVGNADDLRNKLERLLIDRLLATHLGKNGRMRVVKDFSDKVITAAVVEAYLKMSGKDNHYE